MDSGAHLYGQDGRRRLELLEAIEDPATHRHRRSMRRLERFSDVFTRPDLVYYTRTAVAVSAWRA